MNISLPPELEQFVQHKIDSATYASPEAVICAALEFFRQHQPEVTEEESNGAISLEEIERRKQLKLYPYNEQAAREDEESYTECLQQSGMAHEQVMAWLDSIGTEQELPCPAQ
ncbi:MAG: hypothetical protein F6K31_15835 [Symploca sp. SIO2G7]|nr:hypothetical protein [Symploca sp. SIO2G7]